MPEVESLSSLHLEKIFQVVLKSLRQGVRNRGTSISDFADAYERNGRNQELLYVYGRGGKACLRCEAQLVKNRVAGRGTVFCPDCQS